MSSPFPASREDFIETVMQIVTARFPLVKISRGAREFSVHVNGHVASLENLYRLAALRPEEIKHHVERWMVEMLRACEGIPKHASKFEEIKDRILPMVLTEGATDLDASAMVTQPLIDDLLVTYAVDNDRTIAYIPHAQFDKWKISKDELHELAINNLVARSEAINAHAAQDENGDINLILFQTNDGYDAARVLLPTLHERLREHLGSPFCAGIPNRDILLCFRNDEATLDRLRNQIVEDNHQMPHPVTSKLLLVTPDGISIRD